MVKNQYTTSERIKKRIPRRDDPQFEFTQIKLPARLLVCGPSGCGKSNAVYSFLLESSKPKNSTFRHVWVLYRTMEPLYEEIQEQLGKGVTMCRSLADLPSVQDFRDAVEDDFKYQYLVIMDDVVTENDAASLKKINEYYTFGRKKNVTTFFLSQSFFDTPKLLRKNINYLLLFAVKGKRDLQSILREFSIDCTVEELMRVFNEATTPRDHDDIPFLKINTEKTSPETKFSRDWLEFIPYEREI